MTVCLSTEAAESASRFNRSMPLSAAIEMYVKPGMHLHFASTPSRSNAAILALGRRYVGSEQMFVFSMTGMHSTAHLLGLLRLGTRYVACFFGDNYPVPRPNRLYQELDASGANLEQWSLASLVTAFRAGARGERYGITKSLRGTDLARLLEKSGQYCEVTDPRASNEPLSLVRAMRPDITFLHAAVGDENGNALFCPPFCEGFHSALGARTGAIITVERLVPRDELRQFSHYIPLPAHRVLAICVAPGGAHPQPLHVTPEPYANLCYPDDTSHYDLWRRIAQEPALFQQFRDTVLMEPNESTAYREFMEHFAASRVGMGPARERARDTTVRALSQRLEEVVAEPVPSASTGPRIDCISSVAPHQPCAMPADWQSLDRDMRTALLAARAIASRVICGQFDTILAGIGHSYTAARLAKILLGAHGRSTELVIETGLSDFDPVTADPFLLGYGNIVGSKRLTDVDHVLGTLVCGNGGRCLGVVGAAQVDSAGRVNSSKVANRFLVGSGGANDIASAAEELIVITRAIPERLPTEVEFVTSPGERVCSIITESWELRRGNATLPWRLQQWVGTSSEELVELLPTWCREQPSENRRAAPPGRAEVEALEAVAVPPLESNESRGHSAWQLSTG